LARRRDVFTDKVLAVSASSLQRTRQDIEQIGRLLVFLSSGEPDPEAWTEATALMKDLVVVIREESVETLAAKGKGAEEASASVRRVIVSACKVLTGLHQAFYRQAEQDRLGQDVLLVQGALAIVRGLAEELLPPLT
jgi:hypothetical protein